ncbi:MAG: hypothetical protein HYX51_04340 [Chloroflexi bacterium]|nr:hypothetical protein [Chloroflexota bacterium]
MRKLLLVGGLAVGAGVAAVVVSRLRTSGYEDDEIDTGLGGGDFGNRGAPAPEQKMAPAETRTDISPERLSMASRLAESAEAIRTIWPAITEDDINRAEGDLERLTQRIAEKVEQPREQVRERLDGVLAQETPNPSYPAH